MRNFFLPILVCLSFVCFSLRCAGAQSAAETAATAEISADMGPCSALLTVTGADSKPVYGAKIEARIQYGMMGVKKLDLETFTGPNGQAKLAKLPETLKKPLYIHVSKGEMADMVEFKPSERCHATFHVQLQ